MADSPWFPFYVGDFVSDTIHLAHDEVGAYVRLLCLNWKRGPFSLEQTANWMNGYDPKPLLTEFFHQDTDGNYYSPRLEKERDIKEKRQNAGRAGGQAKARNLSKR